MSNPIIVLMGTHSFRNLIAYKKGFDLAMQIYECSKAFPKEEIFSLTNQIRRSSRSVCACIGESYRKRRYEANFISKLTDSDMENTETQVWLDFALASGFIDTTLYNSLTLASEEVGRLIQYMIDNPSKFR